MRIEISAERLRKNEFVKQIERVSGQNVFACFQCGKCTAGCPMAEEMDLTPNQVMRHAQLGLGERLRSCRTVWLCASCFACTARCPKGIRIAEVMEAIRVLLMRRGDGLIRDGRIELEDGLPPIAIISYMRKFLP